MQATSNATLFQTSYSEALGAYRSRKAILTSGLSTSSSNSTSDENSSAARYGFPIHLNPNFTSALLSNPEDLAVEGSGADGGRYRVLSLRVDHGYLWSSEAGGVVRQMNLESGKTINLYRGAKGPVPSFDFIITKSSETLLVAGSWDKALRIYRVSKTTEKAAGEAIMTVEGAMSDFIKAVHVFKGEAEKTYLATGGSDKSIMIFDCDPLINLPSSSPSSPNLELQGGLKCIHQSKVHTRPVNALTSLLGRDGITRLYSADSMGRILEHILNPTSLRLEVIREIQGFNTAVYDLKASWRTILVEGDDPIPSTSPSSNKGGKGDAFLSETQEDSQGSRYQLVAEIWGASGDKSALGFRLSPLLQPFPTKSRSSTATTTPLLGREEPITTPNVKLIHSDFVKSILPLPFYLPSPNLAQFEQFENAIVTGGSDEHLHLFLNPSSSPKQKEEEEEEEEEKVYQVEAHWHEITCLACWTRYPNPSISIPTCSIIDSKNPKEGGLPPAKGMEIWLISASLDGTIRRWNLVSIPTLPKPELKPVLEKDYLTQVDWDQDSSPPVTKRNLMGNGGKVQMTAEEEAELTELLNDDE